MKGMELSPNALQETLTQSFMVTIGFIMQVGLEFFSCGGILIYKKWK